MSNEYELVKAVNSAITGRRDHRAAIGRYFHLDDETKDVFREAFRYTSRVPELIALRWIEFNPASPDGHEYFDAEELDAIEAVIGESW